MSDDDLRASPDAAEPHADAHEVPDDPNLRTLALSDGIIAVAITLLVLDIRLPDNFGEMTDAQLWAALVGLKSRLFAYLLSFAVIGSFWVNHRSKFNWIARSDQRLLWINLLFLLTICLVPFTTNLIAESGGTLATMIYALTMVVSGLSLTWIWDHARRAKLLAPSVTPEECVRQYRTVILISIIFGVSVPLSIAHADLAKYVWILIIPVNFIARVLAVNRWKTEHPGEPVPKRLGTRAGGDRRSTRD